MLPPAWSRSPVVQPDVRLLEPREQLRRSIQSSPYSPAPTLPAGRARPRGQGPSHVVVVRSGTWPWLPCRGLLCHFRALSEALSPSGVEPVCCCREHHANHSPVGLGRP